MRPISAMIVALAATLSVLPLSASAQHRYKWRDASGQTHYSDVLSRDAMQRGYELVNKDGLIIRRVNRQLSAEERVEAQKLAARDKAKEDAIDASKRRDEQLLAAFSTEADLVTTQRLALNQLDQAIKSGRNGLKSQEIALTDLLARADDLQHRDVKVPQQLTKQITDLRAQLDKQRSFLERSERDRHSTAAEQVTQLSHYRVLKAERDSRR